MNSLHFEYLKLVYVMKIRKDLPVHTLIVVYFEYSNAVTF